MISDSLLNAMLMMPSEEVVDIIERKGMMKNILKELRARRDNAVMTLAMEVQQYE